MSMGFVTYSGNGLAGVRPDGTSKVRVGCVRGVGRTMRVYLDRLVHAPMKPRLVRGVLKAQ